MSLPDFYSWLVFICIILPKGMKGRLTMKPSPVLSSVSMPAHALAAERVYQGLTLIAMIVLLVTLWAY